MFANTIQLSAVSHSPPPQTVSKIKPPPVLPILSSIHAHLPMLLSVMCHHWCFPFHLGVRPFKLLFHTNVVPGEIHNCCVARHAIYLCYMATKYDPPIAFMTDSRPERSICKICCIYLPNLKCQVGGFCYIQIFQFVF